MPFNTRQWRNGTELDQLKFPSVVYNIFEISRDYFIPPSTIVYVV